MILKSIELGWSPSCVRVNRSDGSVWVTGKEHRKPLSGKLLESLEKRTGPLKLSKRLRDSLTRNQVLGRTHQYGLNGELQLEIGQGGHSLDVDPSDHSVWIAGVTKIFHYSVRGKKLHANGDVSADQKYIVVLPKETTIPGE